MSSADFTARVIVDGSQIEQLIGILNEVNGALQQSGQSFQEYASQNQAAANSAEQTITAIQGEVGPLNQLTSTFETGVSGIQQFTATEEQLGPAMQSTNSAIESGVGPLNQLGVGFQEAGTNVNTFSTDMSTLESSAAPLTSELGIMNTTVSELGPVFGTAGTETQTFSGALSNMNTETDVAVGGLTNMNTVTNETTAATEEMGAAQQQTTEHTSHLGAQIASMTGLFVGAVSSIFGIVHGYEAMEKAQIKVDRLNFILSKDQEAVEKAQTKYNDAVAKFGPNSAQAQAAARDLQQAQQKLGIDTDKAKIATDENSRALTEFALNVAGTIGTLGGFAGTLQQIISSFRQHRAEQALASRAALTTTTGFYNEAAAAGVLTGGLGGLGAGFVAIAAPIAAAIALFALIETNTFGLGDAFRLTTNVIAEAIDNIVNNIHALWNGFVGFLNNLSTFTANVTNAMVSTQNAFINAFNGIITGVQNFINTLQSGLIGIPNFFISNIINPTIGAWNNFLFGLEAAWQSTTGKIVEIFKPVASAIMGAVSSMVGGVKAALNALGRHDLDAAFNGLNDFQKTLDDTGKVAQGSGKVTKESFQDGIPTLPLIDQNLGKVKLGLISTAGGFVNAGQAGHVFDSLLQNTNTHIAAGIAQTVNYYSSWNNVSRVLQGQVSPALQNTLKFIFEHVKGGQQLISSMLGVGAASAKEETGVKASGQAMQQAETNTKELDKALSDMTKNLGGAAGSFTEVVRAANLNADAIKRVGDALDTVVGKQKEANDANMAMRFVYQNMTPELAKHITQVQQQALADAQLSAKLGDLNKQTVNYNNTLIAQTNKMSDAVVQENNEAQAMNELTGTTLELEKVRADANKTLAEANSKLSESRIRLTDATSAQRDFTAAILTGASEADKFVSSLRNEIGAAAGFRTELAKIHPDLANFAKESNMTQEQLKQLVGVVEHAPSALSKLDDAINKTAESFLNDLVKAADEGTKKLMDKMKELEQAQGFKFRPEVELELQSGMAIQSLRNQIDAGLKGLQALVSLGFDPGAKEAIMGQAEDIMNNIQSQIASMSPDAAQAFQPVIAALQKLRDDLAAGVGTNQYAIDLQAVLSAAQAVGAPVNFAGLAIQNSGTAASTASGQLGAYGGTAQGQVGPVGAFNTAVGGLVDTFAAVGAAMDAALKRLPGFFATQFAQAVANATAALVKLQTSVSNLFMSILPGLVNNGMTKVLQTSNNGWAQIATGAFLGLSKLQTSVINSMANITNSITRGMSTARSAANTAFSAIAGSIAGYLKAATGQINAFISNLGRVNSAFAQARSSANSFGSAVANAGGQASAAAGRMSGLAGNIGRVAGQANQARAAVQNLARAIASLQNRTITITQRIVQVGSFIAPTPTRVAAPAATRVGTLSSAAAAVAAATPATVTTQQNVGALSGSLGNLVSSFGITKDQAILQFKQIEGNIDKYLKLATGTTSDFNDQVKKTSVSFDSAGGSATEFGNIIQKLNDIAVDAQKAILFLNANVLVTKFFSDFATASINKLAEAINSLHDKTINIKVNQTSGSGTTASAVPLGTSPVVAVTAPAAGGGGRGVSKLIRIEIPLTVNGKELARVIRQFIFDESGQF